LDLVAKNRKEGYEDENGEVPKVVSRVRIAAEIMALWLSRKSAVIRVSKYGTGGGRGGMCFVNGSSGQVHAPRDTSDMGGKS